MTQGIGARGPADSSGKDSGPTPGTVRARPLAFIGEAAVTLSEALVGARIGGGNHLGMFFGDRLSGLQTQEYHLQL